MLTELDGDAFVHKKAEFSLLIDARSPKEFTESHIPEAQNYYALSDSEHHEVGYTYKQISHNDAKVLGAHYICLNVAKYLLEISKKHPIGSKIGIYCAKGGLRSSSIAIILSHVGYQVFKLKGGYKSYRYYVLNYLDKLPHKKYIVLGGNTGCGKSELLKFLPHSIDLEAFANHLGSTFGSIKGIQPSQKMFENSLFEAFFSIPSEAAIFIEGESKRIGNVTLPTLLHNRMKESFRIEITAPIEQRVQRILKDYIKIDDAFFYKAMQTITPYIKTTSKEEIIDAYQRDDLAMVAKLLLIDYYDIVYKKPSKVDFKIDNADIKSTLLALNTLHVKFLSIL
ncbi:MAG: tRNA 2-selenouridine(34) synthase MnmH [Sulfurospirillaceae bacterium]|nr:tRNA 2-selenouridine(34) synthase MnmH [Sulfurospirillaceae bacterium]MDD2827765.1 tRNA 2-selenouridine(34) synthase MnmH [Sulfurospirillaceae bacterium]